MKKLLKNKQLIYIVSQDIKGSFNSTIEKLSESNVTVMAAEADLKYYKKGDVIEAFAVVEDGMLYFKPVVLCVDVENNFLELEYNKEKYELLQRREYTRVDFDKEFTITVCEKSSVCKCIDICAGGMKFVTTEALNTAEEYKIEFTLENTVPITCYFKPIRVMAEKGKAQKNIVSGKFVALKNIDKIAIVQFCFKKNVEGTNK